MIKQWFFFLVLFVGLISCNEEESGENFDNKLEANLFQVVTETDSTFIQTSAPRGTVLATQSGEIVTMTINLIGFAPNTTHAVHLHHGTCEQPKHHWNAGSSDKFCNEKSLGIPWAKPFAGDFGNISVGYDGSGSLTIKTDLWKIGSENFEDIVGLQVIIHDKPEDFTSECDPAHAHSHAHSNVKIACGTLL